MEIITVIDHSDYYLVNGSTTIPKDTKNVDFHKIETWVASGNMPEPYSSPRIEKVSMRQARLALLQKGFLDTVITSIAGMGGVSGQQAQIQWEYATEVSRTDPLVMTMANVLNLTSNQLDELFTIASAL